MTQLKKQGISLLLALIMLCALPVNAFAAASEDALASVINDTAAYLYQTVNAPQVGSIGGEWAVLGLARSGCEIPEGYIQRYYAAVEAYVTACKGVLHEKKYTEYSRLIVALSSIGVDARDVAGYDLTYALGDYDKTIWQGINGPIWALISLDSGSYPMPVNTEAATQATRQMYIDRILACQLDCGGWNLTDKGGSGSADPDITAMALQALASYQDQAAVKTATDKALAALSGMQNADGGFSSYGVANAESVAQVIVALCALGISPEDPRFVKNGSSTMDALMSFYRPGNGFLHISGGSGSDQMATEQAFYALVAAQRAAQGRNSLYCMSDAIDLSDREEQQTGTGLPGKHADVSAQPITAPGRTFADIASHADRSAIEALAAREIINGYNDTTFGPEDTITRAQFAAIVVRALGLPLAAADTFADVPADSWYAAYVGTACTYGIVNGTSATTFTPEGAITRQEAAVMVARAAKLCGLDTALSAAEIRDLLAQFSDYVTADEWAREGLAFCYGAGILDQGDMDIRPRTTARRCEVAQMVFHLLDSADLL